MKYRLLGRLATLVCAAMLTVMGAAHAEGLPEATPSASVTASAIAPMDIGGAVVSISRALDLGASVTTETTETEEEALWQICAACVLTAVGVVLCCAAGAAIWCITYAGACWTVMSACGGVCTAYFTF